ncbi:MAG: KamA family radical SAM protein [Myxococcales bacterium]|nr:KamA family radical SAM protein [Myxococcales bacterium]
MVGREEVVARRPDLADRWADLDGAFPVRVTRSFWDRMADPSDPADPLALQVLPDPRELLEDAGDIPDPVGDAARSPVPWVVRKHRDRVLLLLTKRCHLYCRYCFRRDHQPGASADPDPEAWERALAWIREQAPREVILSGGDPLVVPVPRLLDTIDRLRPAVRVIRVHTRAPITFPEAVTDALVAGLRARAPVWVVVHANHPRELSVDVDTALARLVDAGIPVLDQTVLLRGVNDDPDVLAALFEALVERRVMPYYLHVTDRVPGNAHLRVPLEEAIALHDRVRRRLGGVALPKLVLDPPDGSGKVDAREALG